GDDLSRLTVVTPTDTSSNQSITGYLRLATPKSPKSAALSYLRDTFQNAAGYRTEPLELLRGMHHAITSRTIDDTIRFIEREYQELHDFIEREDYSHALGLANKMFTYYAISCNTKAVSEMYLWKGVVLSLLAEQIQTGTHEDVLNKVLWKKECYRTEAKRVFTSAGAVCTANKQHVIYLQSLFDNNNC
ncbi:hypothetical protein J4410_06080, partial [Candidatus Woesearchaeota archaeon]|nr:hypothetical protein [Candidatus Woesearchaeota archaeon]